MTGKADLPPHLATRPTSDFAAHPRRTCSPSIGADSFGGDAPVQVELAGATGGDRRGWRGGRCAVRLRLAAGMIPSQE